MTSSEQNGVRLSLDEQNALREQLGALQCNAIKQMALRAQQFSLARRPEETLSGVIIVALMDGRRFQLQVHHTTSIPELQRSVCEETGVLPRNQVLKFQGKQVVGGVFKDHAIPFGSVVHLLIMMYQICGPTDASAGIALAIHVSWMHKVLADRSSAGAQLEHKVNQFSHVTGEDHRESMTQQRCVCTLLDASGRELGIVHSDDTRFLEAVQHSGSTSQSDSADQFWVRFDLLPADVSLLLFTLCSRHGTSAIRKLVVAVTDSVGTQLARYTPALRERPAYEGPFGTALVLCCATRDSSNRWIIVQVGARCSGYVYSVQSKPVRKIYHPLAEKISNLLQGPLS